MEKKIDYNKKMLETISSFSGKKTLLLHSCCGPCSSSVIEKLAKFFDITIYYYNPNIVPKTEYEKRKENQLKLISSLNNNCDFNIKFLDCDYDNADYSKAILGLENLEEGSKRCFNCFKLRLEKTCETAIKYNFDFFSTTLSVSPHKNVKWICEILMNLGKKIEELGYKTQPLLADFKKNDGFLRSIQLSKKYNLYRQNYCGCTPKKFLT